jgi:site-specific recombinase XerD
MTIYSAGLRLSEVVNLRVRDIKLKDIRIFIIKGKGDRDRFTLLSQINLEVLREYWKRYLLIMRTYNVSINLKDYFNESRNDMLYITLQIENRISIVNCVSGYFFNIFLILLNVSSHVSSPVQRKI